MTEPYRIRIADSLVSHTHPQDPLNMTPELRLPGEIEEWLRENVRSRIELRNRELVIEDDAEAMLFKLRWGDRFDQALAKEDEFHAELLAMAESHIAEVDAILATRKQRRAGRVKRLFRRWL